MSNPNGQSIDVTPHTYVEVRVTNKGKPLLWDGKPIPSGETVTMRHFEAKPQIVAGLVELVRVRPGYNPAAEPTPPAPITPPEE